MLRHPLKPYESRVYRQKGRIDVTGGTRRDHKGVS